MLETDGKFNPTLTSPFPLDERLTAIYTELVANRSTRRSPKDSRHFSPFVVCDLPNLTPQPTNTSPVCSVEAGQEDAVALLAQAIEKKRRTEGQGLRSSVSPIRLSESDVANSPSNTATSPPLGKSGQGRERATSAIAPKNKILPPPPPRRHFPAVGSPEYTAAFTTPFIELEEVERREQADCVRVDPELARLCIALALAPQFRLWLALRNETGWVSLHDLKLPVQTTPRHLHRLLLSGEGVFWRRDHRTERLYLVGIQKLAAALVAQAPPHLIDTNLPGMLKDVLLPLRGSLEQFEAFLYSGWLAAKDDPKIARATLCKLFNRDRKTLRRWEKRLGERKLKRIEAYAQIADPQYIHPPEHSFAYVAAIRDEPGAPLELKVRVAWQLPNTYRTSGIRQHNKRGQGRKVLAESKTSAGLQPLDAKAEGTRRNPGLPRNPRHYFESGKRLRSVSRKYGESADHRRYLWLGVNRRGHQIYEPNENGYPETHYNERLRPIEEGHYLGRLRRKMGKGRR